MSTDTVRGVSLDWLSADELAVEFYTASVAKLLKQCVWAGSDHVSISLAMYTPEPEVPLGGFTVNTQGSEGGR